MLLFEFYYFEGDDLIDLGGEWVHGEVGNVVFELAWPLGLLERSADLGSDDQMYDSSGVRIDDSILQNIFDLIENSTNDAFKQTGSLGDAMGIMYKFHLQYIRLWPT